MQEDSLRTAIQNMQLNLPSGPTRHTSSLHMYLIQAVVSKYLWGGGQIMTVACILGKVKFFKFLQHSAVL